MKFEYELTIKIKGDSLQEVDDALVQAAGDRLKARILGGIQMPTIKNQSMELTQAQETGVTEAIEKAHERRQHENKNKKTGTKKADKKSSIVQEVASPKP